MNCRFNLGGRNALLKLGALLCLLAASAGAQTSSGQLTITMNVQSSISLIFQDNASVGTPGFCPLTNTGFTALDATDTYSQRITKTLQVQVRNNVPAQILQETITFLATAN